MVFGEWWKVLAGRLGWGGGPDGLAIGGSRLAADELVRTILPWSGLCLLAVSNSHAYRMIMA